MTTQPPPQVPPMNVPPPPRQGSRWRLWLLLGGGGCLLSLFVLFVGFVGCAALIGTSGGESTTLEDDYASISERAAPIGETVEVGDVAWTINSAQQTTELSAFGESKQGNFVVVDLTFINNGSEAVTLDSASLAIIDSQNRTHQTDPDASVYVPTNQDLFLNQVNPGVTNQGRAIFDVAPDAQGLILQAGDTVMFTDENAYIDLGI